MRHGFATGKNVTSPHCEQREEACKVPMSANCSPPSPFRDGPRGPSNHRESFSVAVPRCGDLLAGMRITGNPEEWLAWLTGKDERKWHRATLILGGLSPENEVDTTPLVKALASENRDVVFWSTVGLGRLGARASGAICELSHLAINHHQFGVRQAAVRALSKIGPSDRQAKSAVLAALDDPNPFVRQSALQALIDFKELSKRELSRIEAMEVDPDRAVSNWAVSALRNIQLKGRTKA